WSGTHTLSERFYDEGSILSVADNRSERQEQKHDLRANFSSFSPDRSSTLYGSINADYRKYDNYGNSSSDRSGLINSIEERWTDRQGDQLHLGINVQRSTTFGEKWRMNNALNVSYNGDQSDEEDRTDVFAQDNPAHEPDSTVHQLRNSISNGWNYNLRNDLTWDLSERLKVRG